MIHFQNSQIFPIQNLNENEPTVSTLLVPAHLINQLNSKRKEHGNRMTGYLRDLLKMYRTITHSGMIPLPKKMKTEFQEEGLDLKRVCFRPQNADWLELGQIALAFGKSRCWLFTFLLEIDIAGLWNMLVESGLDQAVPTKNKLRLCSSISLRRVAQEFIRSYHVRV